MEVCMDRVTEPLPEETLFQPKSPSAAMLPPRDSKPRAFKNESEHHIATQRSRIEDQNDLFQEEDYWHWSDQLLESLLV